MYTLFAEPQLFDRVETMDVNNPVVLPWPPEMMLLDGTSINLYVDPTLGNDGNAGTNPAAPLQTIAACYKKAPVLALNGSSVTINLAAGAGSTVALYPALTILFGGYGASQNLYRYRGPAMIPATLTTGPTSVVGGMTITVVGRRTQIDFTPNPAWTANNLRGKFARFMRAGVQVFFELPIAENDNDTIFIDATGISGVLQVTDTLEIVVPGARITSPSSTGETGVYGIAGYMPTPPYWGGISNGSAFERIQIGSFPTFAGVFGLTFDRCTLNNFPFVKGGNIGFINTIITSGIKLSCQSMEFAISGRREAVGNPINQTVAVELMVTTGAILIGNPDGNGQYMPKRNVSVYGQTLATRGAIHVFGNSSQFWAEATSPAAVALFGSGNAGPFIQCVNGAQARIGTTAGATPLTVGTGTGNPLRVGSDAANPAVAYGAGVGAFEEVLGFNGNLYRVNDGTALAPTSDGSRIFTP